MPPLFLLLYLAFAFALLLRLALYPLPLPHLTVRALLLRSGLRLWVVLFHHTSS